MSWLRTVRGGERAVVTYDNKICLALAKGMGTGSGFLCLSVLAQIIKYPPLPGPGTLLLNFFFFIVVDFVIY